MHSDRMGDRREEEREYIVDWLSGNTPDDTSRSSFAGSSSTCPKLESSL